jgi:hypothetical protein
MYIQNTNRLRGFKLMFTDWLKFSLIEELSIVLRQLYFHIYYFGVGGERSSNGDRVP